MSKDSEVIEEKSKTKSKPVEQPLRGPQQEFKKRSGDTKPAQPETLEE